MSTFFLLLVASCTEIDNTDDLLIENEINSVDNRSSGGNLKVHR